MMSWMRMYSPRWRVCLSRTLRVFFNVISIHRLFSISIRNRWRRLSCSCLLTTLPSRRLLTHLVIVINRTSSVYSRRWRVSLLPSIGKIWGKRTLSPALPLYGKGVVTPNAPFRKCVFWWQNVKVVFVEKLRTINEGLAKDWRGIVMWQSDSCGVGKTCKLP